MTSFVKIVIATFVLPNGASAAGLLGYRAIAGMWPPSEAILVSFGVLNFAWVVAAGLLILEDWE